MNTSTHVDARLRWLGPLVVTALGAALRLVDFGRVPPNPFYDAAVRSMSQSWHNLFYGAFEPGGQMSIDKMPVDLWLQVLSTKLFGFGSVPLRLPEVIAGVLAIPLLYDLVRRLFGRGAGLVSATALAVLPISVVTARSDTMDSVMMLLIVGAAWFVVRARESDRALPLVGAGAVMGLAFAVKLFEALIVLPALVVLFGVASPLSIRTRLAQLVLAGAAFVGVAISWLVAVSLSPAGNRPYPIGSKDGTVWSVVFSYNGLDRIRGRPSTAQLAVDPPGITRLFSPTGALDGRLVGASLVAALALGAAALASYAWQRGRSGRAAAADRTAPERQRRAGAWFFGVWLLVGSVLFSHMGRLQPRYLEAFTPAVAATTGIGIWWLASAARHQRPARALLALAVLATALLAPHVADITPGARYLALAAGVLTVIAAAAPPVVRAGVPLLALLAVAAVCAVPTASTVQLVRSAASSAGRPGYAPPGRVAALSRYLKAHQGRARYEAASTNVYSPGPLITRDGRPVLMLTTLAGRPILTATRLAALVSRGDVKYALYGGGTCLTPARMAHCQTALTWARAHGTDVSRAAGQSPQTVYRLSVQLVPPPRHRRHRHRAAGRQCAGLAALLGADLRCSSRASVTRR